MSITLDTPRVRGALPGSWVIGRPIDIPDGFRLQVQMPRGMHAGHVEAAVPLIAAAYHTVPEAVRVLSVGDHSRCLVEVIESRAVIAERQRQHSRLREVHPWTEPTLDPSTGRLQVSVGADGTPGDIALWIPGQGARHTWWVGATRAGKTGTLSTSLLSATAHGLVVPWVVDMQGGVSLGEWDGVAPRFAGDVTAARRVFADAARLMDERTRVMGQRRLKVLDPSPEFPVLLLPVDEAPEIAADAEAMHHASRVFRMGLKVLVVFWWSSQMGNGGKAFGGGADGPIGRSQVKAGNVVAFRADGTTAAMALDGFGDINPAVIPANVPGACLIAGAAHEVPVLGRGIYEPDPTAALARWANIPSLAGPSTVEVTRPGAPLSASEAAVLALLVGGGTVRTGDVVRALCGPDGMSVSTVKRSLAGLADKGHIRSARHGEWEMQ